MNSPIISSSFFIDWEDELVCHSQAAALSRRKKMILDNQILSRGGSDGHLYGVLKGGSCMFGGILLFFCYVQYRENRHFPNHGLRFFVTPKPLGISDVYE